jgi:hypothetical protein
MLFSAAVLKRIWTLRRRSIVRFRTVWRARSSSALPGNAREIIKWKGGDHVGPHGFPCRRARPFPFYICYFVDGDTIYFLGLVHERRHPDFLKDRPGNNQ